MRIMKKSIQKSQRAPRNITWQLQAHRSVCQHQYEVFSSVEASSAARRCMKCGNPEVQ
jgi:hypothetical protein